jgi:hypothetical protein
VFFFNQYGAGGAKDRNADGFMPRDKQFGYMFTQGFATADELYIGVAHELGHGMFSLKHPFDNDYKMPMLSTDNLMDYNDGNHIAKWQWDLIHDPGVILRVFERDEDAMRVNILSLSEKHQKSLQLFLSTKEGYAFIGRYMKAGETLNIGDKSYTWEQTGDREKDWLQIRTDNIDVQGRNEVNHKYKSQKDYTINTLPEQYIDKLIQKDGVYQIIRLNEKLSEKDAVITLGHEVFVHADKDADVLTSLEQFYKKNPNMMLKEKRDMLDRLIGSANKDHRALGNGEIVKFENMSKELTKITKDKYYENAYYEQVQDYKNRGDVF